VPVDGLHAYPHDTRQLEDRQTRRERFRGEGVAQVIRPAHAVAVQSRDPPGTSRPGSCSRGRESTEDAPWCGWVWLRARGGLGLRARTVPPASAAARARSFSRRAVVCRIVQGSPWRGRWCVFQGPSAAWVPAVRLVAARADTPLYGATAQAKEGPDRKWLNVAVASGPRTGCHSVDRNAPGRRLHDALARRGPLSCPRAMVSNAATAPQLDAR
jgi:hypothetical protein